MKSKLENVWLPSVMQSTPTLKRESQILEVTPSPPAEFSALAIQISMELSVKKSGNIPSTALLPGYATMSPIKQILKLQ